jgi:hypothetical protein
MSTQTEIPWRHIGAANSVAGDHVVVQARSFIQTRARGRRKVSRSVDEARESLEQELPLA